MSDPNVTIGNDGNFPLSSTDVSPTIPPSENPTISPTSTITDCNVNIFDCSSVSVFPTQIQSSIEPVSSDTNTIPTSPSKNSIDSQDSSTQDHQSSSLNNTTLIFIIIPIGLVIISLIITGIIIYKRTHKKQNEGTILQFEPMHPHVVVVDADGNSLGKRSSIVSTSNNSFIGGGRGKGNRSPSRMIKVLAYDNEETESIVGNNPIRKTMYYEDYS
ncbi:hypothetical protein C1645_781934 [Glomus cerebriforme]|uniref:Uncharacterized protein n=1 Tax=Glomus cerebriforme TaxID=658196 RepID=A0A397SMY4_9GLOM|nr:hypothetical protein C1645_781934 [Glomus cerebriforme]